VTDLARAAIRRLRTGVVPSWELERLSVGYGKIKELLDDNLGKLKAIRRLDSLFIRGEWGTGKTHFLSFAQAISDAEGFATARIDLNARGAALSHPQRIFPMLAETVRAGESVGMQQLIMNLIGDESKRRELMKFSQSESAGDLGPALSGLCRAFEAGDRLDMNEDAVWRILYGADLSWSDHPSKREKALFRTAAFAALCRAVGFKGLVLVLDEAETIDQLWNVRSRLAAYAVMGRLSHTDCVWCIFGITKRFDNAIKKDLQQDLLQMAIDPDAMLFLRKWHTGRYRVIDPPPINAHSANELADRVGTLYRTAYRTHGDPGFSRKCVDDWMRNPGRNPRRLIRLVVHRLDAARAL
jgi:P-loop Domain of unknown function (DUF2791)